MRYRIPTLLVISIGVICTQAFAGTITQTSVRSGNDLLDWGQLPGPELGVLITPLAIVSNGGLNAQLTTDTGQVGKDQQGNLWNGNFAPGDNLIYTGQFLPVAPVVITFGSPVFGVGAQMGFNGGPDFTANMIIFGTMGQVLGTYTAAGFEDSTADNSAVYIGAVDSSAEIASVEFFASNGAGPFGESFAINQISITTSSPIPEPSSLLLLASGIAGAAGVLRRGRKKVIRRSGFFAPKPKQKIHGLLRA